MDELLRDLLAKFPADEGADPATLPDLFGGMTPVWAVKAVARLEDAGLVELVRGAAEEPGRRRYAVTAKGREARAGALPVSRRPGGHPRRPAGPHAAPSAGRRVVRTTRGL